MSAWGDVNVPCRPETFDRLLDKASGFLQAPRRLRLRRLRRRRPGLPHAHPRRHGATWHALFAHTLFLRPTPASRTSPSCPQLTVVDCGALTVSPRWTEPRSEAFIGIDLKRRLVLIVGTMYAGEIKKSVFSVLNYLLPEQGVLPMHCAANMGRAGGRGPVLRPVRHGQDHALRRPAPPAHRRRRARLERPRRLQRGGRLLRQGHPPLPAGGAPDLQGHPLRVDPRERQHRPPDPGHRLPRRRRHGEHARHLSGRAHPWPRRRPAPAGIRAIVVLPHLRRVRRAAAHRAPHAGDGRLPLPVGVHVARGRHGGRRRRARADVLDVLRRALHAAGPDRLRADARGAHRPARHRGLLARQHRLDGRPVRHRPPHRHRRHPRPADGRAVGGARRCRLRAGPGVQGAGARRRARRGRRGAASPRRVVGRGRLRRAGAAAGAHVRRELPPVRGGGAGACRRRTGRAA